MNPVSPLFSKIDTSIEKKVDLIQGSYFRYAVRAILACLFLGLGTAVAFAIAMKGEHIVPGLGKMLYAFMFSWSLVMILYLNAEIGGLVVGFLIAQTGPFQGLEPDNFFFTSITGKLEKSTVQILIEAMFANIVVNTAVLISMRMKDDAGKVAAIIFIIFIFAFLGYEHVIANFPAFSLAYFASGGAIEGMTTGAVLHNLICALIGNYIGGGLVMGLGFAWLNNSKSIYVD